MRLAMAIEIIVMIGAPLVLAALLRRRFPLSWSLFGAGAATFVLSQVVHLPLNWGLSKIPGANHVGLPVVALVLGLSAGLCEELARYVVLRTWKRDARSGAQALMFGVRHGGIESILLGLLAAWSLYQVAVIERVGVEQLGIDPAMQAVVRKQLASFHHTPSWMALMGALERLLVIPTHLAATMLVAVAVVRRRPIMLLAAIGLHALLDAGTVFVGAKHGPLAAEGWIAGIMLVSLFLIRWGVRALPSHDALVPPRVRPTPEGEPLELSNVVKTYGDDVRALKGVSFTIRRGERACLLGPNGAGKTTAIRLVTGALAPTSGWAFLHGAASGEPEFLAAKRRVGIVPQQPGMYEDIDVRTWLTFVRSLYDAGDVDEVVGNLGLSAMLDRKMNQLSGGMQRRVCIAAALLAKPELLILDEPSAGLDPVAAREVIDYLKVVSRDRTTLLCTHNLAEAEELCDSVIILRDGEVLIHESIAKLRDRAPSRLAMRALQGPELLARALGDRGHSPNVIDGEVMVGLPNAEKEAPALLRSLLGDGLDLYECHVRRPTLEDLFLQVVRSREETKSP